MGELVDRIGLRMLVDGDGLPDNFKKNSLFFMNKFKGTDKSVLAISVKDIKPGMFYHFHYLDSSNWMQFSPVFVTDSRKFGNRIIIFGVNLNFIPIQIRAFIFDKFMVEQNFSNNSPLVVNYSGMYNELRKYGFEYALVEYNAIQIKMVHRIDMEMVPQFLIAQHPVNKYDPGKLFSIWKTKIKTRDARDSEIVNSTMQDFFDVRGEISEKYVLLKDHIQRLQNSMKKFGQ